MSDAVRSSEPDDRAATSHDFADARFALQCITARIRDHAEPLAWLQTVAEEASQVRLDLDVLVHELRAQMFRVVP